eukprot:CAMPEP_0179476484 /NCGR_PEP_ID=MMETSP0799-20121207/55512_1 /TAXON_ID=46947 /ORGANISM="Geminigera cryophila, Strain CCMP2564" /LENGTH=78 /DNA_ID=CAMNT_0021286737 /DNA_START=17 /DNA_END=253 /DNA_ORIENTATION=-
MTSTSTRSGGLPAAPASMSSERTKPREFGFAAEETWLVAEDTDEHIKSTPSCTSRRGSPPFSATDTIPRVQHSYVTHR